MRYPDEPQFPQERGINMGGIYDVAELEASRAEIRQHVFRHRWLKIALSENEYTATHDLETNLLIGLYPHIYAGGPEGMAQQTNAERVLHLLTGADLEAENFGDDLMKTYTEINNLIRKNQHTYDNHETNWHTLSSSYIDIGTDDWVGHLYDLRNQLQTAQNKKAASSAAYTFFTDTFETRVILINLAKELRADPHMQGIITLHDAFSNRYGLN